jgi:hypothetical protein
MNIADELQQIGESAPAEAWDDIPPSDSTPASLWAALRKLRAFAADVLGDWPDCGSLDGAEVQDLAVKHGLLRAKYPAPTKPCRDEGCACAEYYGTDFNGEFEDTVECYERTELLGPNGSAKPHSAAQKEYP